MTKSIEDYRAELSELRSQLATLNARANKVDAFLRAHEALEADDGSPDLFHPAPRPKTPPKPWESPKTIRDQVLAAARLILSDGKPRPTREIVDALPHYSVKLNRKDPVLAVSAILSHDKKTFHPSRKVGWSLKRKTPDDVAASPGH